MHSAPAVVFPVGRSRFQRLFFTFVLAVGFAACITWTQSVAIVDWRQGLCCLLLLVAGLGALRGLQQPDTALLAWDGQNWQIQKLLGSTSEPGQLLVRLDLQFFMLLEFRTESASAHWFWLDRVAAPGKWLALRRAAYGRLRKPGSSGTTEGRGGMPDATVIDQPLARTGG